MNEVANAIITSSSSSNAMTTALTGVTAPANELFVINLCASMTPMPSVPKSLKGFEDYKLYQVSRVEDGRRRFRLRLGFFTSETDAELLLSSVRGLYPAAFTGCATSEDMRFNGDNSNARAAVAVAKASMAAAKVAAVVSSTPVVSAASVTPVVIRAALEKTSAAPLPQAEKSAAIATSAPNEAVAVAVAKSQPKLAPQVAASDDEATQIMKSPARGSAAKPTVQAAESKAMHADEMSLEFTPTVEPGVPSAATQAAGEVRTLDNKPFHVARGITLPEIALDFAPEPIAKPPQVMAAVTAASANRNAASPSPATPPSAARKTEALPARSIAPAQKNAPTAKAPTPSTSTPAAASMAPSLSRAPVVVDDYIPILDTTLTIRTLTQAEVEDPNQPTWFVVQLTTSDHPFDLDAMPRLDIFAAYRLYSVVVTEGGTIRHMLRLGFFREGVSAEAVSGYLKTFFPNPTITRIGVAEHNRFAEPRPWPAATAADSKMVNLGSDKREPPLTQANSAAITATKSTGAGKTSQAAVSKGSNKAAMSASGIRQVKVAPRPQSFLSRLIGRDLD